MPKLENAVMKEREREGLEKIAIEVSKWVGDIEQTTRNKKWRTAT